MAEDLIMLDENESKNENDSSVPEDKLVIMRLPINSILEGKMLKLSVKDALEIIANLAVQVALGD